MSQLRIDWPLQKDCPEFYGNPMSLLFAKEMITQISTPWKLHYGSMVVSHISIHKKCADAFEAWFDEVWANAGHKQATIDSWGLSSFSGSFVVRPKREGTTLSMHAYGCAIDFDAAHNAFHDNNPRFGFGPINDAVVKPFKKLGGTWGGDWKSKDGMHFQFAKVL